MSSTTYSKSNKTSKKVLEIEMTHNLSSNKLENISKTKHGLHHMLKANVTKAQKKMDGNARKKMDGNTER